MTKRPRREFTEEFKKPNGSAVFKRQAQSHNH